MRWDRDHDSRNLRDEECALLNAFNIATLDEDLLLKKRSKIR